MTKKISEIDLLKAMNEIPDEWVESCYEKNDIEIKPAKHEKRTKEGKIFRLT